MVILSPEQFAALPKRYEFDEPITVAGPRYMRDYDFPRMHLIYTGGPDKGPALTFGVVDESELDVCSFRGLRLGIANDADEGIRVADGQHCIWQHVIVNGHCGVGIRFFHGQWHELNHPIVAGADTAIMAGIDDNGKQSKNNCFHIYGGQVRNCKTGVRLSATSFSIRDLDCSNCAQYAVYLSGSQYGTVKLYTETQRDFITARESALIKLVNCRGINISGMLNCSERVDYCIEASAYTTRIFSSATYNAPREGRVKCDGISKITEVKETAA